MDLDGLFERNEIDKYICPCDPVEKIETMNCSRWEHCETPSKALSFSYVCALFNDFNGLSLALGCSGAS